MTPLVTCQLRSPCPHCGNLRGYIGQTGNSHSAKVICANPQCHRFQKWLSKKDAQRAKDIGRYNADPLPEPPPPKQWEPPKPPPPKRKVKPVPEELQPAIAFLGLQWPFDRGQFQSRFRELSKQFHPDYGGDSTKFRQLIYYRQLIKTNLKTL